MKAAAPNHPRAMLRDPRCRAKGVKGRARCRLYRETVPRQSIPGRGTAPAPQYRGQSEVVRVAIGLVPA